MLRAAAIALFCLPCLLCAQNTGKIAGKVTDALTHRPIQGAHVSITVGKGSAGSLTAFDGSYTLEDVPAGKVRLTANLDGYQMAVARTGDDAWFTLAPGDAVTRNFELHPLGRIYGKLTDRDTGTPIDGHPVTATRKEYLPGYTMFIDTSAGPKGADFDIGNLEAGDYIVAVGSASEPAFVLAPETAASPSLSKKFYGQRWYPNVPRRDMATLIHLGEGESRNLDIALTSRETHNLSATVEAPREFEHRPVSLTLGASDAEGVYRKIDMPSSGPFSIENLTPGNYRLVCVTGKDDASADYQFEITDHDIDGLKMVLAQPGSVSGEIRMLEEDAKVPGITSLMMVPTSGWLSMLKGGGIMVAGRMISGRVESGKFHQDGLRPGEYWPELPIVPPGYAVAQVLFAGSVNRYSTMNVSATNTPLTFVLTSHPGAIAGLVLDHDDAAVPGATVILLPYPVPDKVGPAAIRTDESSTDGAFAFRDLAPGNYRAVVLTKSESAFQSDMGYLRQARGDTIEVSAGQTVTVRLKY